LLVFPYIADIATKELDMAQTSLNFDPSAKHLDLEKIGVMAGFVTGLTLAVGVVNDHLVALDAPQWLSVAAGVAVVAVATSAGLRCAVSLARRLG
jgi:hypothetical protein